LIGSAVVFAAAWLFVANIHDYLCPTVRVGGDVLVIEGWVPDTVIEATAEMVHAGEYSLVYVSGMPLVRGKHMSSVSHADQETVASLINLGLAQDMVIGSPSNRSKGDRTVRMARAIRLGMEARGEIPERFDVITDGTHARRSWQIYRAVFKDVSEVGIISIPSPEYDAADWTSTSVGAKQVVIECVGLIHTAIRGIEQPSTIVPLPGEDGA